jgi:hypothetical protein
VVCPMCSALVPPGYAGRHVDWHVLERVALLETPSPTTTGRHNPDWS